MFRALAYRDFFLFWSSYFVSNVGSWMQSVAQGWLLFELTSSPLYLGLFSAVRMVLLVCFFLLGGLMADRLDRRKVMLCIQSISALTALSMAVLVSLKVIHVWHIFVLGAITSTAWAFEQPIRQDSRQWSERSKQWSERSKQWSSERSRQWSERSKQWCRSVVGSGRSVVGRRRIRHVIRHLLLAFTLSIGCLCENKNRRHRYDKCK